MASVTLAARHVQPPAGRRRGAFYAGAAVDILLGLDLLLFGGWIAGLLLPGAPELFGLSAAAVLRGLGLALLIVGADTILLARSEGRLGRLLPAIPALNWAFAAALALALIAGFDALSGAGAALVAALAAGSVVFALLQQRALSRRPA